MDAKAANNPSSEARRVEQRPSWYSTQVAGVLVAAFTISALSTVISTLSGVMHGANNPILWIFYVVGFELAAPLHWQGWTLTDWREARAGPSSNCLVGEFSEVLGLM